MDLFPGTHIHIGGDEADVRHWTDDPEMQALMKSLKLANAHELHSWFHQADGLASASGMTGGWSAGIKSCKAGSLPGPP